MKKKLLKKYQWGNTSSSNNFGGATSTPQVQWNPSYKMGPTGDLNFNTPEIKPFQSNYGIDYSGGGGGKEGGISAGAQAGINAGMTALSTWSQLPEQIKQGQALVDSIKDAKHRRTLYNRQEGVNNTRRMWDTYRNTDRYGNAYGNSQGKHGGYLPKHQSGGTQDFSGMYGSSMYRNANDDYNQQLANLDYSDVIQNTTAGITEQHLDAAVSSLPMGIG